MSTVGSSQDEGRHGKEGGGGGGPNEDRGRANGCHGKQGEGGGGLEARRGTGSCRRWKGNVGREQGMSMTLRHTSVNYLSRTISRLWSIVAGSKALFLEI